MSEPLLIGLVAEGPTDAVVIDSALRAILRGRSFVLTQLQPEQSLAFGPLGTGWVGVHKWCAQSAARGGGHLRGDRLAFATHRLLILHVDADVAGFTYASGNIVPAAGHGALPCALRCPPPRDTADAIRSVLLSWCGEQQTPNSVVLCVPSKSTEAWVMHGLFPTDAAVAAGIECHRDPESRLGQQPVGMRLRKKRREYLTRAADLTSAWPRIASGLTEAARFEAEVTAAVAVLGV